MRRHITPETHAAMLLLADALELLAEAQPENSYSIEIFEQWVSRRMILNNAVYNLTRALEASEQMLSGY